MLLIGADSAVVSLRFLLFAPLIMKRNCSSSTRCCKFPHDTVPRSRNIICSSPRNSIHDFQLRCRIYRESRILCCGYNLMDGHHRVPNCSSDARIRRPIGRLSGTMVPPPSTRRIIIIVRDRSFFASLFPRNALCVCSIIVSAENLSWSENP